MVRLKIAASQVAPTPCTLGRILANTDSCHKLSFSRKVGMISYDELSEDEVKLIQYRSGSYRFVSGSTICLHHKICFVEKFEVEQRFCCDPFGQYASKVKSCLKVLELEDGARFPFVKLIPGRTCCYHCYDQLKNHDKEQKEAISDPDYGSKKVDIDEFNKSLHVFGISPIKAHTYGDVKARYGKRKLKSMKEKLSSSFNDLMEEEISNNCDSCTDLSNLTSNIKEKLKASSLQLVR